MKRDSQTTDQILLASIEPFRRRDHLQRATRILLRVFTIALAVAVLEPLAHKLGLSLPLFNTLVVTAGTALFIGLALIPRQRPSVEQTAHLLDRRLGLREQLHTAIEVEEGSGLLAARLHQQARDTLRHVIPARVLPWPSLRREGAVLGVLGLLLLVSSALTDQLPTVHLALPGVTINTAAAAPQAPVVRHQTIPARTTTRYQPGAGQQRKGSSTEHTTGSGSHPAARFLSAPASMSLATSSAAQSRQEELTSTQSNSSSSRSSTDAQQAPANTAQSQRQTSPNSADQTSNSTSMSQGDQASASQQASTTAQQASQDAQAGLAQTQSGRLEDATTGSAKSGTRNGTQGTQNQVGQGQPTQSGAAAQAVGQGNAGNQLVVARAGTQQGGGGGSGRGAGSHTSNPDSTHAQLNANSNITINGLPRQGGQITLTGGKHGSTVAASVTMTGASTGATSNNPSYVAPDTNTVAPNARPAVRGYFTPQSNGR